MLELVVTGFVAAPALHLAANIATWCFKAGARHERNRQRSIIRSTRAGLAEERSRQCDIEREARRRLNEERRAAHQAHYEMLGDLWAGVRELKDHARDVLEQFEEIQDQNRQSLQSLALTPEQRVAIHECRDQLERGIQRLRAYRGPYLQQFFDGIHDAQVGLRSHEFDTPELPEPVLPDDFPYAGELLEFDGNELEAYPFVDLGNGQRGRFVTPTLKFPTPAGPLAGLVQRYDRAMGFWILSAAAGDLARDITSGDAFRVVRSVTLAEWRGEQRLAVWTHEGGEQMLLRLEGGALSAPMRRAPWGTPLPVYLHGSDFFLRHIRAGERVAREHKDAAWDLPCEAAPGFWKAYTAAAQFSDKMLLREVGMQGDRHGAEFVLRLATGQEFAIQLAAAEGKVMIQPPCGARLGLVKEGARHFFVFLLRGTLAGPEAGDPLAVARLKAAVHESFAEQQDLVRLAEADALELKKYRAVLQAEIETARKRKLETLEFSEWQIPEKQSRGPFVVQFRAAGMLSEGLAVRVEGEEGVLGWSQAATAPGVTEVAVLFEKRQAFRDDHFPHSGKLEAVPVDRELQSKMDAIENFLSAAAAETRTTQEQAAFSRLRRELLGQFSAHGESPALASEELDEHQGRAVSLLASTAPLVLIQGPPGTGKTHVIAHAINQVLSRNPKARIAITSQANPAVDEAIDKIQKSFPALQIYRDYSAAAKEKYAALDRGVSLDHYHSDLMQRLEKGTDPADAKGAEVQAWLRVALNGDRDRMERDLRQMLSRRSQIVACTLSRLAGISASAASFDLVIVDEAAKASVPEAMIAANCAQRLALVGDHHQLLPYLNESYYEHSAPTEADRQLLRDLWNDSLFSRVWKKAPAERKAFLAIMRRSRRPIAECISTCFYGGELIPGRDHKSKTIAYPLSLVWIDASRTRHIRAGQTTIRNPGEAELVLAALEEIGKLRAKELSVAVIAFHRGQAELLESEIKRRLLSVQPNVLTVDASQGGQWDVVILSLARTHGSSGFVGNPNRLNVALSRAKEMCLIVGSREYAFRDRTQDSRLAELVRFVESEPRSGKWFCFPDAQGTLPQKFGFPPATRPRR